MDIREFLQKNKNKKNDEEKNIDTKNNQVASNNDVVTPKKLNIREFLKSNKTKNKEAEKEKRKQRIDELNKNFFETQKAEEKNRIEFNKNIGKGAYSNIQRYNAFLGNNIADFLNALTPFGDNILSPYLRADAEKSKQWIKNYNAEEGGAIAKLIGEIGGDPVTYLGPTGLVSKGGKLARMGQSALAGAGLGSGMQYIRNETEDRPQDDLLLAGGIGAGVNALIAGITKGKVDNAEKIRQEISNYLSKTNKNVTDTDILKMVEDIHTQDLKRLDDISKSNYLSDDELQTLLNKEAERQAKRDQKLLQELQKFNNSKNPTPEKFNKILNKYGNKRMEDDNIDLYLDLKAYEKTGRNDPMELRAIYDKHTGNTQGTREYELMKTLQEYNESGINDPLKLQKIFADYRQGGTNKATMQLSEEQQQLKNLLDTANGDPVKTRKLLDDYYNITPESRANFSNYVTKKSDNIPTNSIADDVAEITSRVSKDINIPASKDEQIANAVKNQIQNMTARQNANITGNTPFDDYIAYSTDDEIKSLFGTTKDEILNIRNKLAKGEEITQSERTTLNKVYNQAMDNQEVNTSAIRSYVETVENIPQVQAVINTMEEVANIENSSKLTQALSNINPIQNAKTNALKSAIFSSIGATAGAGSEFAMAEYQDRNVNIGNILGGAVVGGLVGFGASKGRAGLNIQNINNITQQTAPQVPKRRFKEVMTKLKENSVVDWFFSTKLPKHTKYLSDRKDMWLAVDKGNQQVAEVFRALSKLSVEAKKELHEYLVGDIKTANKSIMELADGIRETVNSQGQKVVDLGLLSQEAFDEWKDIYLFRQYEPTLKETIKRSFNKSISINAIEMRGKQWKGTQEELAMYEADDMIGRLSEGKISYTIEKDGSVTFRRDWTKEERTRMGEVTDGAVTVANTLQNLNKLITVGKFLQDTDGIYGVVTNKKMDGYTQLNGAKWGALNGKYVPTEIANDLKGVSVQLLGYDNPLRETWQSYLRGWKRSKTVYNPKSHINNIIGNTSFLVMEGYPVTSSLTYIMRDSMALNGLNKLKDLKALQTIGQLDETGQAQLQKLMQDKNIQSAIEADSYGLFEGGKLDELLMNYIDPSRNKGYGDKIAEKLKMKPILDKMQKAYQIEDNAARLSMYKHLREKQGMTPEEAIKEIRRLVPDYRQPMGRFFQIARDSGIMPFISWTYYTFPALIKQLNPFGTSKAGAGINKYRAYNMAKVLGSVFLLDMLLTPDTHIWSEQPKGFQGKRLPIMQDSNGNVTGVKIDRWLQQSGLVPPWEFFRSNAVSGIPQKIFANIGQGRDPYFDSKITYNEGIRGAYDTLEYAVKSYIPAPQFMYDLYNVGKTALIDEETRRTQRVTNPRSKAEQLATFFGLNVMSYNKNRFDEQQQEQSLKEYKKARKETDERGR